MLRDDPEAPMATLATPIRDEATYRDPACVKVVCSSRGRALYFSRSPIPCHRDGLPDRSAAPGPIAHLHLGLYAYRRDFLLSLATLPPSPLEAAEKLEQLRVLEAGLSDRRRDRRGAQRRHRHARGLPPVRRTVAGRGPGRLARIIRTHTSNCIRGRCLRRSSGIFGSAAADCHLSSGPGANHPLPPGRAHG